MTEDRKIEDSRIEEAAVRQFEAARERIIGKNRERIGFVRMWVL